MEEIKPTVKIGYLKVRVKWNALSYYSIAGYYRTQQEVIDKIQELSVSDDRWKNVIFKDTGVYILDGDGIEIARYNYQPDMYIGRPFLKPIMSLPIFDLVYYSD